jgi:hypothetical protein
VLTNEENLRGWVAFVCPRHGFLVATTAAATVTCGDCHGVALPYRDGQPLDPEVFLRLRALIKAA